MPAERNLADRISEVLRVLTRDAAATPPEDTDTSVRLDAGVAERPFDEAVRRVTEAVEQWRGGRSLLRFVQESGRDRIAAAGFEVVLSVKVEALYRGGPDLADRSVRFLVDGIAVGEARTDERGLAHLSYVPAKPGLKRVTYEVLSGKGRVLRPLEPGEYGLLQVVAAQPVAAIDASLLVSAQGEALEPLRELARRGWALCYVDLHELDRTLDLRAIVEREALPAGATLVHPAEDLGFPTLQVDFAHIFAASTLRRVRALGVPVVLAVVDPARVDAFESVGGVTAVPFEHLESLLDEERLGELAARATRMVRERDAAGREVRFTRNLDIMTGSRLVEGNEIRCELDNRAAREAVFAAVERAERTIHAQFYILREGRFADQLLARLVLAARRGVRVRFVVDALYSGQEVLGLQNASIKALSGEPNVEVLASDPITLAEGVDAVRLKQRDHRKLVIVDGAIAFVSGRNAGDEYYEGFDEVAILDTTSHERIPWLDAHLEIRGPLVAEVQRVFLENWRRNRGAEVDEDQAVYPPLARVGSSRARIVHHDGLADANALLGYEAIILGARHHLLILNDFPVLATLAAALKRAVERGVRVDFLTGCAIPRRADGTFFKGPIHRELFEYMSKRRFEPLIRGGVHVYEVQIGPRPYLVARGGAVRPYVHAKVVTADGEVASVGSANLDATASYWEREVNAIVEDPAVVGVLEAELRALVATAAPLDLESEYWKRESARRAITDTLWPDVMYS